MEARKGKEWFRWFIFTTSLVFFVSWRLFVYFVRVDPIEGRDGSFIAKGFTPCLINHEICLLELRIDWFVIFVFRAYFDGAWLFYCLSLFGIFSLFRFCRRLFVLRLIWLNCKISFLALPTNLAVMCTFIGDFLFVDDYSWSVSLILDLFYVSTYYRRRFFFLSLVGFMLFISLI